MTVFFNYAEAPRHWQSSINCAKANGYNNGQTQETDVLIKFLTKQSPNQPETFYIRANSFSKLMNLNCTFLFVMKRFSSVINQNEA